MAVAGHASPTLAGRQASMAKYRDYFDHGVRRMAALVAGTSHQLAGPDGPLQLRPGYRSRIVLRPTEFYARLLVHRLSARSLAAADGGWPTTDRLLRRFQVESLASAQWDAVRAAETAALSRADIPYFLFEAGSGTVFDGNGELLAIGVGDAKGTSTSPGVRGTRV